MGRHKMKIKIVEETGNKITLEIIGSIKSGMEFDLADTLEDAVKKDKNILLDLKKVPFVNSATLGIFLNINNMMNENNSRFSIKNLSRDVRELINITKISTVINIERTDEDL